MMPTLTSTVESVAWSALSNVGSLEFARLFREYNRTIETTMTLRLLSLCLERLEHGASAYLAPRANMVISPFFWLLLIWRLRMTRMGRHRMITSCPILKPAVVNHMI